MTRSYEGFVETTREDSMLTSRMSGGLQQLQKGDGKRRNCRRTSRNVNLKCGKQIMMHSFFASRYKLSN